MADELRKIVRETDRDRYLSTLLAPAEKQVHLFALYAFASEISRIPKLVSEPQIGEIRMQWWSDTLASLVGGHSVDHPVARALGKTIFENHLPVEPLQNLIEARRFDLYADRFPSLIELEGYLGETESVPMQMAAIILAPAEANIASAMIGSAGVAFGLARLVSRSGLEAKYVPVDENRDSLTLLAKKRLAEAQVAQVPESILPAVLPVCLTELYLNGQPSILRRHWHLWRAARAGTIR
jgi:15-cis-phytoene synthase